MEPFPASADAGWPGSAHRGTGGSCEATVVRPDMALAARIGLATALVGAGSFAEVGRWTGLARPVACAIGVVVVVLSGAVRLRGWVSPEPASGWIGAAGAAFAGALLGSAGYAGPAVVAVIPLAWIGGASGQPVPAFGGPAAGAVLGLTAGAITGRMTTEDVAVALGAAAVAALATWAGGAAANEFGATELERTELRRLRSEMVTTVSHELRTPLAVIQGATATLSRRWDVLTEPERLDLVDVLTENVASLDASILHFADAARLERGEVVLAPEWVSLREPLAAAVRRRAAVLAGHEVRADLVMETLWADRIAVERILEHLLLNAARFSAVGLPILVRSVAGPGEVMVTVTDQGQGIAPRLLSKVWEPLQRGDVSETGVSRGAGLGLPIVRELARLHGGDATLSSIRGRGTTVSVWFPQPVDGATGLPVPRPPELAEEPRRGALSPRSG